jgi:hypothetical protein
MKQAALGSLVVSFATIGLSVEAYAQNSVTLYGRIHNGVAFANHCNGTQDLVSLRHCLWNSRFGGVLISLHFYDGNARYALRGVALRPYKNIARNQSVAVCLFRVVGPVFGAKDDSRGLTTLKSNVRKPLFERVPLG